MLIMAHLPFYASQELKNYLWEGTYSKIISWETPEPEVNKEKILGKVLGCLARPPFCTIVRVNLLETSLDQAKLLLANFLKEEYHKKPMPCPEVQLHPNVPDILLVSTQGLDKNVIITKKEVIVGRQCGTAVLRGANVFAPGVLAAPSGMKPGDLVSVYSDINGECRRGLIKSFQGSKIFVGNGLATVTRNEIFCKANYGPSGIAIQMTQPLYDSPCLNGFLSHALFLQNLPSVVTSHVLDPRPGDRILDMCAAPGGKTTHIAQIMKDKGIVFALDKSKPKIDKILNNMKKLNLTCIRPFLWDATKAVRDVEKDCLNLEPNCPPFVSGSFDRILLDGPCSALGQRPQQSLQISTKEMYSFPVYQRKLLTVAETLLKPGGTLVYSTCTICCEENEEQVVWVLKKFPSLQLVRQNIHVGSVGMKTCGLTEEQRQLLQRFDPLDMDEMNSTMERGLSSCDTIGFFIAKFVKKNLT